MSAKKGAQLHVFCDADWGSCVNSRRSIIGYLVKYGTSPISWKSKKQVTISRSSVEVEYRSLTSIVSRWSLQGTGIFLQLSIFIHCNVKSTIQIVVDLVFHEQNKYISIDCYFIGRRYNLK